MYLLWYAVVCVVDVIWVLVGGGFGGFSPLGWELLLGWSVGIYGGVGWYWWVLGC